MSHRLKLIKALSYTRGNVTATKEKPFVEIEDAETAEALLASGYFASQGVTNAGQAETVNGATADSMETDSVENPEADSAGTEGTEADTSATEGTQADSGDGEDTETESGVTETESAETKPDYDALSKMSKTELTAYAKERDIDISKCKTKNDILTAISVACGGSPTMIDLQRESDGQGGDDT